MKTDSKLTTAGADLYANADTAYVFVDETLGFGKTAVEVVKGGVNVDATAFAGYGAKVALYGWDADKNETAKAVFFTGAYTDAGLDAANVIYFKKAVSASQTSTSSSGYVYTGYDCSTGKTKEITVAAPLAGGNLDSNGFFSGL